MRFRHKGILDLRHCLHSLPLGVGQELSAVRHIQNLRCLKLKKYNSLESQDNTIALRVRLLVDVDFTIDHRHDTISKL